MESKGSKTYLAMITEAVLAQSGRVGVSDQAIKSFLKDKYNAESKAPFRKALVQAVALNLLAKDGRRFKVVSKAKAAASLKKKSKKPTKKKSPKKKPKKKTVKKAAKKVSAAKKTKGAKKTKKSTKTAKAKETDTTGFRVGQVVGSDWGKAKVTAVLGGDDVEVVYLEHGEPDTPYTTESARLLDYRHLFEGGGKKRKKRVKKSAKKTPTKAPTKRAKKPVAKKPAKKAKGGAPPLLRRQSSLSVLPDTGLPASCNVLVEDTVTYDASLNVVHIDTNTDKFYRVQIVVDSVDSCHYVVIHWGRTGTLGQFMSNKHGADLDSAKTSFCNKFKEKAGVPFSERAAYTAKDGKYSYVHKDYNYVQKGKVMWKYFMDNNIDGKANGWYDYAQEASDVVESLFREWKSNAKRLDIRSVQSGYFSYKVDFNKMGQENTSTETKRKIKRTVDGKDEQ